MGRVVGRKLTKVIERTKVDGKIRKKRNLTNRQKTERKMVGGRYVPLENLSGGIRHVKKKRK